MALWNIFFGLFFAALSLSLYALLLEGGTVPTSIPIFDLALIMLATFRLTRLVAYDEIFHFFRDIFEKHQKGSLFGTLKILVNCPWCMGLWFAMIVTFFYFYTPYAWFFILFLAVAGVASLFLVLSNFIGWSAEWRKREVLLSEHDPKNAAGYRVIDTGSKCG